MSYLYQAPGGAWRTAGGDWSLPQRSGGACEVRRARRQCPAARATAHAFHAAVRTAYSITTSSPINGNRQKAVKINTNQWKSMQINENQCKSMKINEISLVSIDFWRPGIVELRFTVLDYGFLKELQKSYKNLQKHVSVAVLAIRSAGIDF